MVTDELQRKLSHWADRSEGRSGSSLNIEDDGWASFETNKDRALLNDVGNGIDFRQRAREKTAEIKVLRAEKEVLLERIAALKKREYVLILLICVSAVILAALAYFSSVATLSSYKDCADVHKRWLNLNEFTSLRGPIRDDPGQCWWDGPPFTPEICCSPWYGDLGHVGCWTADMNFDRCCREHWTVNRSAHA